MAHTILVIDGEPVQLNLLCTVLKEKLAYQTVGIAGSHEATDYIRSTEAPKPDLILFDVSMVADGFETLTHLRILAAHTPIIALVKYGDYATAMVALGSGAQDFLTKPVAIERLGTTLRNALHLRDAQHKVALLCQEPVRDPQAKSPGADTLHALQSYSLVSEDGNIRRMEQIEAETIRLAMQHYNGHMTEVARRLGIGRSTLYRKLSELGVRQQEAA